MPDGFSRMLLVGRDGELARIDDIVTGRTASQRVLLLRGDAGVGKTCLLDAAAEHAVAAGVKVLRAAGVENEAGIAFSGLHQLLHPLLHMSLRVDPRHRNVILGALGDGSLVVSDQTKVMIAALEMLCAAAEEEPLLVILDDVQWLDSSSATVLAYIVRRLQGSRTAALVAARSDAATFFDSARLPEIEVLPLTASEATVLLAKLHPHLNPQARDRVLADAEGNPLAIEELPRALAAGGLAETPKLPDDLPLSKRLESVYARRVEELPQHIRQELLLAALDGQYGWIGSVTPRLAGYYLPPDADEALALGLLISDPTGNGYRFRHPLVRSAIVQRATGAQRRAAHAELAALSVPDPERWAWHLAAAATGPDERVALALVEAARLVTLRGGASSAVSALTRAAELSTSVADRSRRLADAAYIAGQSAQLEVSERLLEESRRGPADRADPYAATVAEMYILLYRNGEATDAHRGLLQALRSSPVDSAEPQALQRALNVLMTFSLFSGDPAIWALTDEELLRFGDRVNEMTHVIRDAWGDVARSGHRVRSRLAATFNNAEAEREPWSAVRYAVSAFYVDAVADYRQFVHRIVDREGASGAVTNLMVGLEVLALDYINMGELDAAESTSRRGLGTAEQHGYGLFAHQFVGYLALIAAIRGSAAEADRLRVIVEQWGRERSLGLLVQYAALVATLNHLAQGQWEAAFRSATTVTPPGAFTPHSEQAPRMVLDLVEAALYSGRKDLARQHALAASEAGLERISARYELLTLGALAMTAPDPDGPPDASVPDSSDTAGSLYQRALAVPGASQFPFDHARVRLSYGTWLRRSREQNLARAELEEALSVFDRVGAEPWAERTRRELRAAGGSPARSGGTRGALSSGHALLTGQELEIATLAARGLSNKEIGAQLFLSPRTIGSHLYKVFPKLGISSRGELRNALGGDVADD
ncbi:LuxR family transcriptional regulator [Arthrobacter sp. SO5]|uniref:helix-turn-helix transcriptional regulator n=1 Tax=Arthrobacter sp. SO5 TaxID=1897055 RepID=UPI001E510251|nr:LuxR family transcriptional regulator [Arthrobacter sp. SO5]